MSTRSSAVSWPASLDRPFATRLTASRRRALAFGALAVMSIAAVLVVAVVAGSPNELVADGSRTYPGWLLGPLRGIGIDLGANAIYVLSAAMFACYLLVLVCVDVVPVRLAIASVVGLHVLFLLAPPIGSSDAFFYIGIGRLGALDGLDPYAFGRDAGTASLDVTPYTESWKAQPTAYGPLFTLLSYPLAHLDIAVNYWILRVLSAAASLGSLALIWRCAQLLGRPPLAAMLFVGLNPLLLVWTVGGAHNDTLMMFFALAGVLALLRGAEARAAAWVIAGIMVKLSIGPLVAFVIAGARRRRDAITGALLAGGATMVLAAPFLGVRWPLDWLDVITYVSRYPGSSPLTHLMGLLRVDPVPPAVIAGASLLMAATIVVLLVRTVRGGDWITNAGWAMLAVLFATLWVREWYVLWLLPLAALSPSRRLRGAALGYSLLLLVITHNWIFEIVFPRA